MNQGLYSLQGNLWIAKRLASGKPGAAVWAGNMPEATLEMSVSNVDKRESFSGSRGLYGRMYSERGAVLNGIFDEWSLRNLALLLHSKAEAEAGGSVTGEVFPADLVEGDIVTLDHPYATDLVIEDSTGSPVTVDPEHYEFAGHNQRQVRLLDVDTYTQPFVANYTYAAYDSLDFFSETPEEVYLIFDGIDTESGQAITIDMFRAQFDPLGNLALINEEYGSLPFSAAMLFDARNMASNGRGGYARIRAKTPS